MHIIPRLRFHAHRAVTGVVVHLNHHRIWWACGIAAGCFVVGFVLHNPRFIHFAEYTLAPVLEAFLSKKFE